MSTSENKVVVRIPPSPTGFFHVGRARTALFNYIFAKQHGGKIIFRLEDTDKERSKDEYAEDIIESLTWLGITYDEGPFRQSERTDVYRTYLHKMVEEGKAYISHEPEGDNKEVVRFKNPNKLVTFTDLIRGDVSMDTTDLGDFVIARNIDDPLYHLTVVVDDFEMNITHVIRGDDGISNTPRQILIQEAIGAPRPFYAHVPLILAADKSKLSGRHGAVSIREYREQGYLPEAMVNFLAMIGWNSGTPQELFSIDELIRDFKLERVQKGGAVFNIEKLNWLNKEYIKKIPAEEIIPYIEEALSTYSHRKDIIPKLVPIVIDRIEKFSDITTMKEQGEFSYYFDLPEYKSSKLGWKEDSSEITKEHLQKSYTLISAIDETQFTADNIKIALWDYATEKGKGNVLWPLRMCLSGKDKSPDPFTLASILGKQEVLSRVEYAIKKLS